MSTPDDEAGSTEHWHFPNEIPEPSTVASTLSSLHVMMGHTENLPQVPLDQLGRLLPEDLPHVLDPAFFQMFQHLPWAEEAVRVLEIASRRYLPVFLSWKRTPDPEAPPPSEDHPPSIHDVLEALHSLRAQAESKSTLELHSSLQKILLLKRVSADESARFHRLLARYPFLTHSVAEQIPVSVPGAAQAALLGSEHVSSDQHHAIDVEDEAERIASRLDKREKKEKDKHKPAAAKQKHLVVASLLHLALTAGSFLILFLHGSLSKS